MLHVKADSQCEAVGDRVVELVLRWTDGLLFLTPFLCALFLTRAMRCDGLWIYTLQKGECACMVRAALCPGVLFRDFFMLLSCYATLADRTVMDIGRCTDRLNSMFYTPKMNEKCSC